MRTPWWPNKYHVISLLLHWYIAPWSLLELYICWTCTFVGTHLLEHFCWTYTFVFEKLQWTLGIPAASVNYCSRWLFCLGDLIGMFALIPPCPVISSFVSPPRLQDSKVPYVRSIPCPEQRLSRARYMSNTTDTLSMSTCEFKRLYLVDTWATRQIYCQCQHANSNDCI